MRKVIAILVSTAWGQLSGTYFINGQQSSIGRSYVSIQAALDALHLEGASDTVRFRVVYPYDPAVEPPTIRVRPYTCQECEVILQIDTPIVIAKAPQAGWWNGQFLLRVQGGVQHFTLNGRGRLTLKSLTDTTAFTGVVGIVPSASNGISFIRIDSCIIEGHSRRGTWAAVYVGDSASLQLQAVPTFATHITLSACTLRAARYGAAFVAWANWSAVNSITVEKCVIGLPTSALPEADQSWQEAALFAQFAGNLTIDSTLFEGCWHADDKTVVGIHLLYCSNVTLRKNFIRNLRSLSERGYGAIGIHCIRFPYWGPTPHLIETNFIGDLSGSADEAGPGSSSYLVAGIVLESAAPDTVGPFTLRHNTIHLYGSAESEAPWAKDGFGAGIVVGKNIQGGVEISGNLIQNTLQLQSRLAPDVKENCVFAFWEPFSSLQWERFTFRGNFYYLEGASAARTYFARIGSGIEKHTIGSLAQWRDLTSLDEGSRWGAEGGAPFIAPDAPQLDSTRAWTGINAAPIPPLSTYDIEGEPRPKGGIHDPGIQPDIGADEVKGRPIPCSSPVAQSLSASTQSALVGTPIQLSLSQPSPLSGELILRWSIDNGVSWQTLGVTADRFPLIMPLPAPTTLPGLVAFQLIALPFPGCSYLPDTSETLFILALDRLGNRSDNPIPLSFSSFGDSIWIATYSANLMDVGFSDRYTPREGHPQASLSSDIFFSITLPDCIDSLDVDLCSQMTSFNTRLHLFSEADTTTDEDQGYRADCTPSGLPASFTSRIVCVGSTDQVRETGEDYSRPARLTRPLEAGTSFLIAVEGDSPTEAGEFTLTIRAYKLPLQTPNLGPDRSICLGQAGFRLSGFVAGANLYRWYLNGELLSEQQDSVVSLVLPLGTHVIVVEAQRHPPQSCAPLLVARDTLLLNVIPSLEARISYGGQSFTNGDTLRLPFGNHTLLAQAQVSEVTFFWRLWNARNVLVDWGEGPTFEREWGERGLYLLELESRSPSCVESDTLVIDVTSSGALNAYVPETQPLPLFYPNPTVGELFVRVRSPQEAFLQSLDGKLIQRFYFQQAGEFHLQLEAPPGCYILFFPSYAKGFLLVLHP
ncbi:MAG: hypothetical protein RMK19_07140 [Bacteroidia bacterium]|nr:right-handed parallel beta-helix repeat-containing protein [Bacteroidia bacterium]MDW8015771.1 hypothetical protein [Bacteroidia bacterium]